MKALSQLKIEIDQAMTKTGEGIYVSSQLLQHVKMWWWAIPFLKAIQPVHWIYNALVVLC